MKNLIFVNCINLLYHLYFKCFKRLISNFYAVKAKNSVIAVAIASIFNEGWMTIWFNIWINLEFNWYYRLLVSLGRLIFVRGLGYVIVHEQKIIKLRIKRRAKRHSRRLALWWIMYWENAMSRMYWRNAKVTLRYQEKVNLFLRQINY